MATKHLQSLEVATEASYGSVGTLGYPDGTGLGAYSSMELPADAMLTPIGDAVSVPARGPRAGLYGLPPEPVVPAPTVAPLRRATLTVDTYLRTRGAGTAWPLYSADPLYRLLRTRMSSAIRPLGAVDPVAVQVGAGSWTPTVAGDFEIGGMVRHGPAGLSQYAEVTDVTVAPLVVVNPQLAAALAAAQNVYPLTTLFADIGGDPSTLETCALRMTGVGWQATAYGCVLTQLVINGVSDDSRVWRCTLTIDCAWVDYALPAALPAVPVYGDGHLVHSLGSPAVMSEPFGGTAAAPYSVARDVTPCVDEWSLTLAWSVQFPGCGASWTGRSKPEATDLDVTLEMMTTNYLDLDAGTVNPFYLDWQARFYRSIVLGGSAYDGSAGEGACVYIPAAFLAEEPIKPDVAKDFLRQKLTYKAGRYIGADATTALATSVVRIGLG